MLFGMVRRKKPLFLLALFFILGAGSLMTGCAAEKPESYFGYPLETLMENKTPYVGNNSKVGGLIHAMPLHPDFTFDSFELHTSWQPYRITINLKENRDSDPFDDGEIKEAFYRNSVILFSLIGNVDGINYNITDMNGLRETISFQREKAEKRFRGKIPAYCDNTVTLKNLINELMGSCNLEEMTAAEIEDYLDIIMSSPKTSSNPQDYIEAHREEYESILAMGVNAEIYLLGEFERGDNSGLRGHIMMALCKDLLGYRNKVTDKSLSPQEWYERFSQTQD